MKRSLDQTLAQSRRTYRPTALFLLDLDRFKAVNDTLGHQTGDELLKQVAQRLQRAIGDKGLVGRLRGEEFECVLHAETTLDRRGDPAQLCHNRSNTSRQERTTYVLQSGGGVYEKKKN